MSAFRVGGDSSLCPLTSWHSQPPCLELLSLASHHHDAMVLMAVVMAVDLSPISDTASIRVSRSAEWKVRRATTPQFCSAILVPSWPCVALQSPPRRRPVARGHVAVRKAPLGSSEPLPEPILSHRGALPESLIVAGVLFDAAMENILARGGDAARGGPCRIRGLADCLHAGLR